MNVYAEHCTGGEISAGFYFADSFGIAIAPSLSALIVTVFSLQLVNTMHLRVLFICRK